jgi:hypothetical protein
MLDKLQLHHRVDLVNYFWQEQSVRGAHASKKLVS